MPYEAKKTIRRTLLGGMLQTAREQAGLSPEDVAKKLGISLATVYRQEKGETSVRVGDIAGFARLYNITDEAEIIRWEEWARRSKQRGWWTSFSSTVGPTAVDYADAEDMASELRMWEPLVIPGLLQTREYSNAIISTVAEAYRGDWDVADVITLRERRKEILNRDEPPRLWVIMGEAALCTMVGGEQVMREQWQHLLNLGERPNITLQVLPFAAGAHAGVGGSFVLMSFGEDNVMYREAGTTGVFNDDPAEVATIRTVHGLLQTQALSMRDTRGYLHQLLAPK